MRPAIPARPVSVKAMCGRLRGAGMEGRAVELVVARNIAAGRNDGEVGNPLPLVGSMRVELGEGIALARQATHKPENAADVIEQAC